MKSLLTAAGIAVSALAWAFTAAPAAAYNGEGLSLVVLAEDADRNSVRADSDIFRRVTSELQQQFADYDFNVIDEELWLARMRWTRDTRLSKGDLAGRIMNACNQGDDITCPRAMAAIKIRAYAEDLGYGSRAQVRVMGDVLDAETGQFLGSWEHPLMEFPAPRGCDGVCIEEIIGKNARDIATVLGDTLRVKLAVLERGEARPTHSGYTSDDAGLINRYLLTFKNFSLREYLAIVDMMSSDFPKGVGFGKQTGAVPLIKVNYNTRASNEEINRWLNILLLEMDYPETHFKVLTQRNGREILVEKVVANAQGRRSNPSDLYH